jgi:hypothetical protein
MVLVRPSCRPWSLVGKHRRNQMHFEGGFFCRRRVMRSPVNTMNGKIAGFVQLKMNKPTVPVAEQKRTQRS